MTRARDAARSAGMGQATGRSERGRFWKHLFRGMADASFSFSRSPFSYPIKLEGWGPPSGAVASHSAKACSTMKLMDRSVALAMVRVAETTWEARRIAMVVPGTEGRRVVCNACTCARHSARTADNLAGITGSVTAEISGGTRYGSDHGSDLGRTRCDECGGSDGATDRLVPRAWSWRIQGRAMAFQKQQLIDALWLDPPRPASSRQSLPRHRRWRG